MVDDDSNIVGGNNIEEDVAGVMDRRILVVERARTKLFAGTAAAARATDLNIDFIVLVDGAGCCLLPIALREW